jgi:hypothetical protein
MIIRLTVKHVLTLGQNMVRLILTRPSLRSRIEPLSKTKEQRMREDLIKQAQQRFGSIIPRSVVVRGPAKTIGKQDDLTVDMQITEDEYNQMGRPSINDTAQLDINTLKEKSKSNNIE